MTTRTAPAAARDRGSVLMLMPAAVVIVLLLGAVAVDAAIVYLEHRQAHNVAFDAANDAAGAGLDHERLRETGEIVYDPDRVEAIAAETVAAAEAVDLDLVEARFDGDEVVVTVEVRVQHLFGQAFGNAPSETLQVTARAAGEVRAP